MDNELEELKKKNAKNKTTISILAILVLLLGASLIGVSIVMLNDDKKEEPKEEKQEKKEDNEKPDFKYVDNSENFSEVEKVVVGKLSSISDKDTVNVSIDNIKMMDPNTKDLDKLAKDLINRYKRYDSTVGCESELSDIIGSGKTVTADDINDQRANIIINNFLLNNAGITNDYVESVNEFIEHWYGVTKYRITKEDYIKAGKLLFGKDYTVKIHTRTKSDLPVCLSLFYNSTSNKYNVFTLAGCGGSCTGGKNFYEKYVGAEIVNDELVVTYNTSIKEDMSNPDTYKIHFAKNGNTYSFVKSERVSK